MAKRLVGLHDAERDSMPKKTFPNLALMKLSAYEKQQGNEVEWWMPIKNTHYSTVFSSKVFDFTPVNRYLPKWTIKGGTGYTYDPESWFKPERTLEGYAEDDMLPDYTIYPDCDYAIGFLTRGCPNQCDWCIVPEKEGNIKAYRVWQQVVRQDTDKLVLMDNNILACDHGIGQLYELSKTAYKIDLNQGLDIRLVDEHIAGILGSLKWQKYIRFSCDHVSQIDYIEKVAEMLKKRGIPASKLFIYILVRDDIDDAEYRVQRLKKYALYAQAEVNQRKGIIPTKLQKEFTWYVYAKSYKHHTWEMWKRDVLKIKGEA